MPLHGTSKAYIVDRLKRENQIAFLGAIERGELTPFAVACALGWVERQETLVPITPQARKRQHRLKTIAGDLTGTQLMELKFGPGSTSVFTSREELEAAWLRAREQLMASCNPGRRAQAFYEFEYPGIRPPYDTERSTLWSKGLLRADEKEALERQWKADFVEAQAPDFTLSTGDEVLKGDFARAAHYRWADIPRGLVKRWTAARRRRERRSAAPLAEVAAAK
jgi:hypothetical protein